jgi:hypothetical protein
MFASRVRSKARYFDARLTKSWRRSHGLLLFRDVQPPFAGTTQETRVSQVSVQAGAGCDVGIGFVPSFETVELTNDESRKSPLRGDGLVDSGGGRTGKIKDSKHVKDEVDDTWRGIAAFMVSVGAAWWLPRHNHEWFGTKDGRMQQARSFSARRHPLAR